MYCSMARSGNIVFCFVLFFWKKTPQKSHIHTHTKKKTTKKKTKQKKNPKTVISILFHPLKISFKFANKLTICRVQQGLSARPFGFGLVTGTDPGGFLRGLDLTILPYLLYIFGQTGLSKQCRTISDATVCSV